MVPVMLQLPYFDDLLPQLSSAGHDCPFTLGLGVFMTQAVLFGSLAAYSAVHKGLSGRHWFAAGFFLSFVGLAMAWRQIPIEQPFAPRPFGKTPSTRDPCPCPHCGASLHPCAGRCNRCGAEIAGARPMSEPSAIRPPDPGGASGG